MMQKISSRKAPPAKGRAKRNTDKRALANFKRARAPKRAGKAIEPTGPTNFQGAFEEPPAQYDIDGIEAHVAQLSEQAWSLHMGPYLVEPVWSLRLTPYAVGFAMGFNELADPEGTQCEHETTEAFVPTADSYEVKFDKLVSCAASEFARAAKIPAENQNEFLVGVTYALAGWIRHVDWDNNRGREFLDCLSNTRRSAAALHRDLEKLHRHLKELDQSDASEYLMASIISRMLRYLPTFIGGTHVVMPTHERQGRPRGRRRRGLKQYPGLAQLVSGLEFSAQEAGGGFGIPNKKLKKGRLIQALDWLRAFLASSSDWSWLAELLPAPGQHPFSVYEGALMAIYDLHMTRIATGTGDRTENVTDPAKARIDLEEVRRMRAFAKSMRYIEAG